MKTIGSNDIRGMIKYKAGYKYQLYAPTEFQTTIQPLTDIDTQFIKLNTQGLLSITAGYAWDRPRHSQL